MDYTIERDGVTKTPSYQEAEMIEAANLLWQEADDLPAGIDVAVLQFGGVTFKVYRSGAAVARHEERDSEGAGWYVYVGGKDAGGPFETEADALEHWKN